MPIDREATLRQAEKLHRQGRLDLAIAEYVRLVEEQPRDWNSINALGDLYLRANDVDRAVAQFVHIADHLFGEGFFPKAAAVYKKALKAKPDHEHTLLRLAEIAAVQELLADARAYLRKLWELRSERGDERGAADCLVRLATLPEADAETMLTGARVSRALGDVDQAVSLFHAAAEELRKVGRDAAATDAIAQVVALQPSNVELRRQLVTLYAAAGQLAHAEQLLDAETAGSDPDLLLALAQIQLAANTDGAAFTTLTRFIAAAPDRSPDVLRVAGELGRSGDPHRAFTCSEIVVDDAVLRGDWDHAIDVIQQFLVHGPHIPALRKLVQVSADAGHEDVLQEARERLADACLEEGLGPEAQLVAEQLLGSAPGSAVHAARLRRALELTGAADPGAIVDSFRARLEAVPVQVPVVADEEVTIEMESDANDIGGIDLLEDSLDEAVGVAPQTRSVPHADGDEPVEIDLSAALASLGAPATTAAAVPAASAAAAGPATAARPTTDDLESVFEALRPRGADYRTVAEGAELYERGQRRLDAGELREGLADLAEAARVPAFRFPAATRLGREYVARGHAQAGIEWFEQAAEMPAPSRDAWLALLYELGVALDRVGESTRALALLMEIEADEPGYRDVRQRLEALARAEDERRG